MSEQPWRLASTKVWCKGEPERRSGRLLSGVHLYLVLNRISPRQSCLSKQRVHRHGRLRSWRESWPTRPRRRSGCCHPRCCFPAASETNAVQSKASGGWSFYCILFSRNFIPLCSPSSFSPYLWLVSRYSVSFPPTLPQYPASQPLTPLSVLLISWHKR